VRGNVDTHWVDWVEAVPLSVEDVEDTESASCALAGANTADFLGLPTAQLLRQEPSPDSVSDSWSQASETPSVWT
jgi:hypothetical protein